MKTLLLAAVGTTFLALGIIGLALPFLPGFLFLLGAAACFATLFPNLRHKLSKHPRLDRFFHRLDSGARLDLIARLKLAFWASLEAVNPRQKNRWQSNKSNR